MAESLNVGQLKAQALRAMDVVEARHADMDEQGRAHDMAFRNAAWTVVVLANALEQMGAAVIEMQHNRGGVNIIAPPRRRVIERDEAGQMVAVVEEDA